MLKHNYHTHTIRCNHATLSAEQQIQLAIKHNLKTIGISEHCYSDIKSCWSLKDKQEFLEYVEELKSLREKYKQQIKVLIGLESDIISLGTGMNLLDNIVELSKNQDLDYQILGHHAYGADKHIYTHNPSIGEIDKYLSVLDKALSTKKILYLAHPDGFMKGIGVWNSKAEIFSKRLIHICIKHDIPLGVNIKGIYEKADEETYPNLHFFKLAASMGAKAIYELDSHSQKVWDEDLFLESQAFVKKSGIRLLDKLI